MPYLNGYNTRQEVWFSGHDSGSHEICILQVTVFDSIWTASCSPKNPLKKSKEIWKIIYNYCLTSVCSPLTNRKPWRAWCGRSSCPCILKNLLWDRVPEPQHCLAHGNREPGRCHTTCFVCLLTVQQKCAIPLMLFPRFHLPQAKRADTMIVCSRKLIKSSCLLLHIAASQPPIYKEHYVKNVRERKLEQCAVIINQVENVIGTII